MIENIKTDLGWLDYYNLGLHCSRTAEESVSRVLFAKAYKESNDTDSRLQCAAGFANLLKNGEADAWRVAVKVQQSKKTNDWRDWLNAANAQIGAIQLDDALVSASKAIELGSTRNADAWVTLGSVYSLIGKISDSKRCLQNAMELNHEFSPYYALQAAADKNHEHDDIFWNIEFHGCYAFRKKAVPSVPISLLKSDLSDKTIIVCMEQGIGDAIMLRRAIHWLGQRALSVTLLCKEEFIAFYGSFIWDNVTSNGSIGADYVINLLDLLGVLPDWINFPTPKPWDSFSKLWASELDNRCGYNFTGNSDFPFEHIRGIYDQNARNEIKRVIGYNGVEIKKDLCSLVDLPIYLRRLKKLLSTDTMLAHLGGELEIPTLVLLQPGYDWRFNYTFYKNMSLAVALEPGKWDCFKLKLSGETEFTHCYSSFEHTYKLWNESL